MGLDVYLYKYDCSADEILSLKKKAAAIRTKIENSILKKFGLKAGDLGDKADKYYAMVEKGYKNAGLNEDGELPVRSEGIEVDSEKYPEHMFKIGYFRSSYNDGGLNSVLRTRCEGQDLYWVFNVDDHNYEVKVDWAASLERAKQLKDKLQASTVKWGNRDIIEFGAGALHFSPPTTPMPDSKPAAMDIFLKEFEKKLPDGFSSYSNLYGTFFGEPKKLLAVIHGSREFLGKSEPCVYAVVETAEEGKTDENVEWYLQAMDIVIETCEYVLKHGDPDTYMFHWSG